MLKFDMKGTELCLNEVCWSCTRATIDGRSEVHHHIFWTEQPFCLLLNPKGRAEGPKTMLTLDFLSIVTGGGGKLDVFDFKKRKVASPEVHW